MQQKEQSDLRKRKAEAALAKIEEAFASGLQDEKRERTAAWQKGREIALRYIGVDKSKSSGRVRERLLSRGLESDLVEEVLESLRQDGYLDDKRACARIALRHRGRQSKSKRYMLRLFLEQGVSQEIAAAYMDQLPDDGESIRELDLSLARGDEKERTRLMRRLAGRGYAPSLITRTMEQVRMEAEN